MKNLLLASLFTLGFATTAMATDPMAQDTSGIYAGGAIGSGSAATSRVDLNALVGYQVSPYVRAEADFDHSLHTSGAANMIMGNAIVQYRVPGTLVVPYAMIGAGAGYDKFANLKTGNAEGLFDVGAGVRVAVSKNVEADVRYRLIRAINSAHAGVGEENIFTAGLGYKF